ncbi:regulatory protein MarR [Calderihabitans maritimus]|uniref:Regulatory protein MarR n=2 Tax=Calderihabitans maritimus TaxID=1246530 RepID=A0A1Z5HS53_9FIRM|nr:regulatory protein MarR [Calderihabitans maritimus]
MELTGTDLMVLFYLKQEANYRITDLARKLGIPASTLTGVIDRLEEKGWVCRERSQVDRRVVTIRLGPRYQEQKVVLQNHLTKDAYRLLADLSDNECRQLLEGLKRVEVLIRQKVELSPKTKFGEGGV